VLSLYIFYGQEMHSTVFKWLCFLVLLRFNVICQESNPADRHALLTRFNAWDPVRPSRLNDQFLSSNFPNPGSFYSELFGSLSSVLSNLKNKIVAVFKSNKDAGDSRDIILTSPLQANNATAKPAERDTPRDFVARIPPKTSGHAALPNLEFIPDSTDAQETSADDLGMAKIEFSTATTTGNTDQTNLDQPEQHDIMTVDANLQLHMYAVPLRDRRSSTPAREGLDSITTWVLYLGAVAASSIFILTTFKLRSHVLKKKEENELQQSFRAEICSYYDEESFRNPI